MRRRHFEAFRPVCPVCAAAGHAAPLIVAEALEEQAGNIESGILHCTRAECRHEYPVIHGIPIIASDVPRILADHGAALLLEQDLPPLLESLVGDALGPESWFDSLRQMASTYAWDSYADLDPAEQPGPIAPGAARRCLERLLSMAGLASASHILDLGCGAGGTSFALAAQHQDALVLAADLNLGLLRLARRAAAGQVSYPRRRIGLVYDRRRFDVALPGAERVDFWACDALALPFQDRVAELIVALNLLDCVPGPACLLAELARLLMPGGRLLLSTPYDWSLRATQPAQWIGGHSQRTSHDGAAEPFLRMLLEGGHPSSVEMLRLIAEDARFPWQTRLHERSTVTYSAHLLALRRRA